MPGEFLTDAQERAYGHFVGPPSNQQLSRYFHLDDADRDLVNVRRGAHNKLGEVMWTLLRHEECPHDPMLGRYSFDLPEQLTRGELRSLRDPSEATDQE